VLKLIVKLIDIFFYKLFVSMDSERKELLIIIFILTRCAFCFEFDVVFRLPSLLGLLDEFGDCMLSDPV